MDLDTAAAQLWLTFASSDELWKAFKRASRRRSKRIAIPIEDGAWVILTADQLCAQIGRRAESIASLEARNQNTRSDPGLF